MFRHLISLFPILSLAFSQVQESKMSRLPLLKRQIGSSINITELILELMEAPTAIARFNLLNTSDAGVAFNFYENAPVDGGGNGRSIVYLACETRS
jgi:hypothetical protein